MISTILALALALPQGIPDEPATREVRRTPAELASSSLRRIELDLSRALYAQRPSLARRRGLSPAYLRPLAMNNDSARAWQEALDRVTSDLARVEWPDLTTRRRIDEEWLRAFISAESILDQSVPAERWDPSRYVDEASALLRGAVEAELDPNLRMAIVRGHLEALPGLLDDARETLAFPQPAYSAYALLHTRELEAFLEQGLIGRLESPQLDPSSWRPFERSQAAALQAVVEFRGWLVDVSEKEGRTDRTLGERNWMNLVQALTGSELAADDLKVRLLRDIFVLDAGLGDFRTVAPPMPMDLHPDSICERVRTVTAQAWRLMESAGLTSAVRPDLGCTERRAWVFPAPAAALTSGESIVLSFTPSATGWSEALRRTRSQRLHPTGQRALALQHGLPGSALWQVWARKNGRIAQRRLWNRCQEEGWGLYAADWVTRLGGEENPLARDAALVAEVGRLRLFEAARLRAALALHAERRDEREVSEDFRALTGVDADTAAFEVRAALVDPLRGAGYLAYLELRAVEAELRRSDTEQAAIRRIGAAVAASPSAPTRLALRHLLERAPGDAGPESK